MKKPLDPWTLVALLQAAAILLLGWLVFGDGEVAAVAGAPPTTERTALNQPAERGQSDAPAPPTPGAAVAPATGPNPEPLREIAATTVVYGEVRHRSGAVLKDAYLNLFGDETTKPTASASLRQSPHFAWPALVPAAYRMTVRSDGMRTLDHRFVVPPGVAELPLDLVLEPSWLLKVLLVTPAGQPFHEAFASLVKERPSLQSFREPITIVAAWQALPAHLPGTDRRETPFTVATWRGAREGFGGSASQLPARYAGQLDLPETRAATIGAVTGNVVLAQTTVEAGQDEVTLTVDPEQLLAQLGSVRLQVVDAATQQPLATAKVTLNDSQSWLQPSPVDAEGRVEFRDLRAGMLRLSIEAEDRTCPSVTVAVSPGAVTDLGAVAVVAPFVVRVHPTGRTGEKELRGTLVPLDAPNHAALRSASVSLYPVQAGQDGGSGKEGDLQARVAPGRYELRLTGAGGASLEIDTRKLGPEPLVVELQTETALRIDPSGLAEPLRLVLTTSNGRKVLDRWITWKGVWEQALLPGNYTVELTTFIGTTRREELSVPAAGASYVLR